MLRKRMTAVGQKRNLLGRKVRGYLPLEYASSLSKDELLNHIDAGWLLPMMGGTTAQNTVMANPVYFPKALVVSTDQTINQGDMVWWDTINYTLKPCSTRTQAAFAAGTGGFAGVAGGSNVPGVYPNPPAGAPSENLPGIVVQRGGTAKLNLQANDVVDYPFQPVEPAGVDAQTITKGGGADSSHEVGLVIVPLPVVARGAAGATPTPETVPGGTSVEVWLTPQWPAIATLI